MVERELALAGLTIDPGGLGPACRGTDERPLILGGVTIGDGAVVGEDEADPAQGTVSHVSPLSRAVMGRRVGEEVQVAGQAADVIVMRTCTSSGVTVTP